MTAPGHAPAEVITVTSVEVALLVRQVEQIRLLRTFMGPEGNTVGGAAAQVRVSAHLTYRRVKRLEALGLLRVLGTRPRSGRSVIVYGCPARRFFIPRTLIPLDAFIWEGFEPFLQALRSSLPTALEDAPQPVAGVLVGELPGDFLFTWADQERQVWPAAGVMPTTVSVFQTVRMDYDQAASFNRELRELVEHYVAQGGAGTYLLGLFVTPLSAGHALD